MSCKITYNQNQEPIGVLDNNGNPSKTFQQILSNPNIKGFDQALEIYKGILSLEQKSPEEKTETEDLTPQIQQKVNEGDNSLPHAKQIRKKGIDSLTPSQLEEVISAFTGNTFFSIIGEKGAQNLDQIEEAAFRMENLAIAKEMEKASKTVEEIRIATGWERGAGKIDVFDRLEENEALQELLEKGVIQLTDC